MYREQDDAFVAHLLDPTQLTLQDAHDLLPDIERGYVRWGHGLVRYFLACDVQALMCEEADRCEWAVNAMVTAANAGNPANIEIARETLARLREYLRDYLPTADRIVPLERPEALRMLLELYGVADLAHDHVLLRNACAYQDQAVGNALSRLVYGQCAAYSAERRAAVAAAEGACLTHEMCEWLTIDFLSARV